MPNKTFYLDSYKTEKIDISWGFSWNNTSISHNGTKIGFFDNQKELRKGKEFKLDEFKTLSVKLTGKLNPELELLVNGDVLVGSAKDPIIQLKNVSNLAIGIGSFSSIIGLIAELLNVEFLLNAGLGIISVIVGVIIIVLGILVKNKSYFALSLIMAIILLDITLTLYFAVKEGGDTNPTNGIMIKSFFLLYLFKGFSAIKELKTRPK